MGQFFKGILYLLLGLGLGLCVVAIKINSELNALVAKASECKTLPALLKEMGPPAYTYQPTDPSDVHYFRSAVDRRPEDVLMYAFTVHHFPFEFVVARVDVNTKSVEEVRREHSW